MQTRMAQQLLQLLHTQQCLGRGLGLWGSGLGQELLQSPVCQGGRGRV